MALPTHDSLYNFVLEAMKALGGSASIAELDEEVTKHLRLSDEEISQPHGDRGTELQYRLAWTRTYLKIYGLLDNTERGIWVLTPQGKEVTSVDRLEVSRYVRNLRRGRRTNQTHESDIPQPNEEAVEVAEAVLQENWRESLLSQLQGMKPDAFERLCQRLLRESGFVEVRVTGRSGDGGIDGVGVVRIGGLLGFPVLFQCKRYQGSVGASAVRDFRGAMIGRADRGLILTTGRFSRDARHEATRDGAPPIDLLDGEQLLDKLKEFRLGVTVKTVEQVSVVPTFFQDI